MRIKGDQDKRQSGHKVIPNIKSQHLAVTQKYLGTRILLAIPANQL